MSLFTRSSFKRRMLWKCTVQSTSICFWYILLQSKRMRNTQWLGVGILWPWNQYIIMIISSSQKSSSSEIDQSTYSHCNKSSKILSLASASACVFYEGSEFVKNYVEWTIFWKRILCCVKICSVNNLFILMYHHSYSVLFSERIFIELMYKSFTFC